MSIMSLLADAADLELEKQPKAQRTISCAKLFLGGPSVSLCLSWRLNVKIRQNASGCKQISPETKKQLKTQRKNLDQKTRPQKLSSTICSYYML